MPKASKEQKPKKKGAAHKQPKLSPIDYAHLQKKSTEKKKQFGRAENTNNSYGGQVKRGQEFVARFAMEQAEADKQWKENGEEAVSGDDDEGDSCDNAPAMLDPPTGDIDVHDTQVFYRKQEGIDGYRNSRSIL